MKAIIIMDSIHYILKAEKLLKKYGIKIDLIPVPKEVDSNCGNAIEIKNEEDLFKVNEILKNHKINFKVFKYNEELNFFVEIGG